MSAGSHYTDDQRREAVAQYVVLGNWRKVAEATGIPQRTLGDWSKQTWFHTLLAEVRAEKGAELDGQLTRIIHKATDQLMDRLENGDPVLVAGQIKRKPLSARDLAMVAAIVYDKRALLRDDPTTIVRAPFDAETRMRELERFAHQPTRQYGGSEPA
jgi:transposase-like protein